MNVPWIARRLIACSETSAVSWEATEVQEAAMVGG